MVSLNDLFIDLEKVVQQLLVKLNSKNKRVLELEKEVVELKEELSASKKELKVLENKYKEIKVVSGLSGNAEHKRLMKHKLNSLIKEVDLCIAEVKNKSL